MSSDCTCDNRYFNIKIINRNILIPDVEARYQANLTLPIIDNPKNYYVSLIKFSVPGESIPLWYAETDLRFPNVDPNILIYTVAMRNPATNFTAIKHVTYIPQNIIPAPQFISLPTPSTPGIIQRSPYFFVYSYQYILDLFNTALADCLAALKIADPSIPATIKSPYFIYQAGTQIISLIVPISWINQGLTPFPLELYFNRPTYELFDGFNTFFDPTVAPFAFRVELEYHDNYYQPAHTIATDTPTDYIKIDEEYQIYRNWYPLRNILFISNALKTAGEATPNFETTQGGITVTSNLSGAISFESILTEFTPDLNQAGSGRDQLIFSNPGPYRLIDLISSEPLNQIDMFIYWTDVFGHRFPLTIPFNSAAEVKLLFIKKDVYKQSLIVGKK